MKNSIDVKWMGNMSFNTEINGHKIVMDAAPSVGGENKGPRPKPFVLAALAGCTGMDVVSILKKMRVKYDSLVINVEGDLTEEHPKQYKEIKVVFKFTGENLNSEKIKRAVSLSENQYCGVSAMYKKAIPLTYEITINGEVI